MQYITYYQSPLGEITLASDEECLTGLWFSKQKYHELYLGKEREKKETPVLKQTKKWLDIYFSGEKPNFIPPLHYQGTEYQKRVWEILLTIPYGMTMTYGEIAKIMAKERHQKKICAQAVGGAVGHNKISIIVPCHRVIGRDGKLTGYAGGLDKKIALLVCEGVNMEQLTRI